MNRKFQGIIFITLSAIFFGSYGIWPRLMGNSFGDYSQAWTRGLLLLLFLVPLAIWKKQLRPILPQDWKWFIAIAVSGGFNQAPYFYAFHHLNIGTATLLFYGSLTIGGYILGKGFFNERITRLKLVSLVLAILGMSYLFHFSLKVTDILPALLAVLAGSMGAIEVVLSKKISDRYSTLQILISIFLVMLIGNMSLSFFYHEALLSLTTIIPWLAQFGYIFAMLFASIFVFIGYKDVEPSVGGLIGLSEILFAVLFGVLLFRESLTLPVLIGGALITVAASLPNLEHFDYLR
jgi:drug/metabolite transporter (DMT)-like permease